LHSKRGKKAKAQKNGREPGLNGTCMGSGKFGLPLYPMNKEELYR